eukprot:SAG31_NODE_39728_length_286_cov_0.711230_2_plen_34_part_01
MNIHAPDRQAHPENLVEGLAYARIADPLKGFCKC